MPMFSAVIMTVFLVERVLFVKLFYVNNVNTFAAVREFRRIKNMRHGLMSNKGIWAMIKRFEETGKLVAQPGRDHKPVILVLVDAIETAVASQTSEFGKSSTRAVSQQTDYSYSSV